jgi:hypothetical protein
MRWLRRLRDWLLGGTALADWRLTFYTRQGCHLGKLVPVVVVNGRLRFRGGVNRVLLERLLRAEADRRAW